jgi:hypothetical protein
LILEPFGLEPTNATNEEQMIIELNEAQADYLCDVLGEDLDRKEGHIEWLQSAEAAEEEDKDFQRNECQNAITQASALLALLNGGRVS